MTLHKETLLHKKTKVATYAPERFCPPCSERSGMEIGSSTYTSFELRLFYALCKAKLQTSHRVTQSRRSSPCIFASGSTSFTKPVECTHAQHQCVWHPERITCAMLTAGCEQVKKMSWTVDRTESRDHGTILCELRTNRPRRHHSFLFGCSHLCTTPHANRKHARKSWRSDVPVILPGWGHHTGGSPVHTHSTPVPGLPRRLWVAHSTTTTGHHKCSNQRAQYSTRDQTLAQKN